MSLLNSIMITQKIKDEQDFMLLVYGEEENYLIQRDKNRFILTENKISRSDVTLLKQLEKFQMHQDHFGMNFSIDFLKI